VCLGSAVRLGVGVATAPGSIRLQIWADGRTPHPRWGWDSLSWFSRKTKRCAQAWSNLMQQMAVPFHNGWLAFPSRSQRERVRFHPWISQAFSMANAVHSPSSRGDPPTTRLVGRSDGRRRFRESIPGASIPWNRGSYRRCVQIVWPSRRKHFTTRLLQHKTAFVRRAPKRVLAEVAEALRQAVRKPELS